jgi:hypothetical protein
MMGVLIACEESQAVTIEMRKIGIEAYSCDIQPCSGGYPEWHIEDDVTKYLYDSWDMVIAFPPCTDLAIIGRAHFKRKIADGSQQRSIEFFMLFTDLPHVPYTAIENPISIMSTVWRKPHQIIQPWQYGHGESKATCLWIKGLPLLQPTNIVKCKGTTPNAFLPPSPDRAKIRSKTYPGIAKAMAEQWGRFLIGEATHVLF